MADLIYRNALIEELKKIKFPCMLPSGAEYLEGVQTAVTRISGVINDAPAVNRWIPVEDVLPEEDVSVLCYMRIGEIVVMEYGCDGWYCGVTRYNPRAVSHWMPLPEPPKKE